MKSGITILLFICLVPVAQADWEGFPIKDNTNAYDLGWAQRVDGVMSQLWYACVERYDTTRSDFSSGGQDPSVINYYDNPILLFCGYSNKIELTTGVYGSVYTVTNLYKCTFEYTNVIGRTPLVSYDNGLPYPTASWRIDPIVYTYIDPISLNNVTATSRYELLDTAWSCIMWAMFRWSDNLSAAGVYYVRLNEEVDSSYNTWFESTNGVDGRYPDDFPYYRLTHGLADFGEFYPIFHEIETGYYDEDGWEGYSFYHDMSNILMCEMSYADIDRNGTSQCYFVEGSILWGNRHEASVDTTSSLLFSNSVAGPILTYYPYYGTNQTSSGTIRLCGWTMKTTGVTQFSGGTGKYDYVESSVDIPFFSTNSSYGLTSLFYSITNATLVSSNGIEQGDYWTVMYTNSISTYYDTRSALGSPTSPRFLRAYHLDEVQQVYDALRYTTCLLSSTTTSTVVSWNGYGWEQAETNITMANIWQPLPPMPFEYVSSMGIPDCNIDAPSKITNMSFGYNGSFSHYYAIGTNTYHNLDRLNWTNGYWYNINGDIVVTNRSTGDCMIAFTVSSGGSSTDRYDISVSAESSWSEAWSLSNCFNSCVPSSDPFDDEYQVEVDLLVYGMVPVDVVADISFAGVAIADNKPYVSAKRCLSYPVSVWFDKDLSYAKRYRRQTNRACIMDFYCKGSYPCATSEIWEYSSPIPNCVTDYYQYAWTSPTDTSDTVYFTNYYEYDTNIPPYDGEYIHKGWGMENGQILKRWDIEGGFEYR